MSQPSATLYKQILRPVLFRSFGGDAEAIHERTLHLLAAAARSRLALRTLRACYGYQHPSLERTLFGLRFPNPVGLAAGMDKDGLALPAWAALGFGFVEVGTVTWRAQSGNPRPRLFRLPDQAAVINRMGFNNRGAHALAARLAALGPLPIPLGISIGKSKDAPLEAATADYLASFQALFPHAGYVAINVSSPNTPGLRALQDRQQLAELLHILQAENQALATQQGVSPRPLLVKIAPDLADAAIVELLEVCADHAVAGIIAANTSVGRVGVERARPDLVAQAGGLSGRPVHRRAVEVVALVARESGGRLPIVGVGGIFGPDDARRMLDAGASLLQLYTGLVYEGPGLARRINRTLARR